MGVFKSSKGELKYYIASDNIQRKEYKGLLPSDLMSILDENQIGYDRSTQCGAVFHMVRFVWQEHPMRCGLHYLVDGSDEPVWEGAYRLDF